MVLSCSEDILLIAIDSPCRVAYIIAIGQRSSGILRYYTRLELWKTLIYYLQKLLGFSSLEGLIVHTPTLWCYVSVWVEFSH